LSSGIFSCGLKYAEVKTLFRKGDNKDMSNYRPISVWTAFSKVFEKVTYARLHQHLHNHNQQFGF
jgi:hypothetical protein